MKMLIHISEIEGLQIDTSKSFHGQTLKFVTEGVANAATTSKKPVPQIKEPPIAAPAPSSTPVSRPISAARPPPNQKKGY